LSIYDNPYAENSAEILIWGFSYIGIGSR